MKAIFDANFFINKELPRTDISCGFIPSSVEREVRDKSSREFYEFYNFNIEVRDPQPSFVADVQSFVKDKHFGLSSQDIDVVALMLEFFDEGADSWIGPDNISSFEETICLTKDNGIRNALSQMGLLEDDRFISRKFKLRCYCCFRTYDTHVDFCRDCGYSTITKVSVIEEDYKEVLCLKKNYNPRPRVLKDFHGNAILTEDSKAYTNYQIEQKRRERMDARIRKANKM